MAFTLVQLTDPHIGADWSDSPASALRRATARVREVLGGPPDAVLVSGDIANGGAGPEYDEAAALLEELGAPVYPIPGNHDDPEALRRSFDFPDHGAGLDYAADLGPMRLIALDTKRPGSDCGQLDPEQLAWLHRVLAENSVTPALLAMHHPPIVTGIPSLDAIGIPEQERAALAEIVARHPQVQLITAGHVHRAIFGSLGGTPVLTIPSTDVQLALDLESPELRLLREPAHFALHLVCDGRLVSHLQPV